jgi:alkylation response protein AidB-like acyl-CoA dehydrogenase
VLAWAASTPADGGGTVVDQPWVQMDLARTHARLEAMKLLNWRMTADTAAGTLNPADSSAVKVYGTECLIDVYRTLLGILGPLGYLPASESGAVLRGDLERAARSAQVNTFGGGVNEVQREIVASVGLGMARSPR